VQEHIDFELNTTISRVCSTLMSLVTLN